MGKAIALLINDLHISKDTIHDFNLNWDEALGVCNEYGIPEIYVGGDMFTSRASQTLDVLLAVKNAIQRSSAKHIHVTIAEGNHDKVDQESVFGYNHIFEKKNDLFVIDTGLIADYDEIKLAVMSYFPEKGSFRQKLEGVKKQVAYCIEDTILYIHEGIHGALGDFEIPDELPQDIFSDFYKVLVGHYHNRTKIDGTNIEYIGSSRQNNFGEDEEKGYTILYDNGDTKFVKNNVNVRYATITVDAEDINDSFLLKLVNQSRKGPGYKIRVKVKCTDAQAKTFDKKALLENGASKVELITDKLQKIETQSTAISEKFDKNGIKKEYQSFCNGHGIDSKTGMKYLNMI